MKHKQIGDSKGSSSHTEGVPPGFCRSETALSCRVNMTCVFDASQFVLTRNQWKNTIP
jgi:hypothetical protein